MSDSLFFEEDELNYAIETFLSHSISCSSVNKLLDFFSLEVKSKYDLLLSAKKWALVYNDSNVQLSADEINYLSETDKFLVCTSNYGYDVLILSIHSPKRDRELISVALLKIINLILEENYLSIMVFDDSFIIGTKRNYLGNSPNNFCISNFINGSSSAVLSEILYYPENIHLISEAIISTSPIEKKYTQFDKCKFEYEYILGLCEIESGYQLDLNFEKQRYYNSFTEDDNYASQIFYKNLCDATSNIAVSSEITSYDVLENAIIVEKTAQINRLNYDADIGEVLDLSETEKFDEKLFEDAEKLFKVIMDIY